MIFIKQYFAFPLLLFAVLFLCSCGDSIQSGLNKQLEGADKIRLYLFTEGKTTVTDTNMVLSITDKDEITKITSSIQDETVEQVNCGYTGHMEIYKQGSLILSTEFNYKSECAHFVFRFKEQVYFKKMSPEGQELLKYYYIQSLNKKP